MRLLNRAELEQSWVVANCRMNRERGASGTNSYAKELRFCPVAFLEERLAAGIPEVSWLDICCGSGRALIETFAYFAGTEYRGFFSAGSSGYSWAMVWISHNLAVPVIPYNPRRATSAQKCCRGLRL